MYFPEKIRNFPESIIMQEVLKNINYFLIILKREILSAACL